MTFRFLLRGTTSILIKAGVEVVALPTSTTLAIDIREIAIEPIRLPSQFMVKGK